jgi:hypothetical protein
MKDFDIADYEFIGESLLNQNAIDFFEELEFFSLIKQKKEKQKWEDT